MILDESAFPHVPELSHGHEAVDVAEQARHQGASAAAAPTDVQHPRVGAAAMDLRSLGLDDGETVRPSSRNSQGDPESLDEC